MTNPILAIFSGLLMILAFPKADLYLFAYIALVPLLVSVKTSRSMIEAVICGALSGTIFFGGVLFWINILSKWAGPWAYAAWAAVVLFQAIYIAAFAGIVKYIEKKELEIQERMNSASNFTGFFKVNGTVYPGVKLDMYSISHKDIKTPMTNKLFRMVDCVIQAEG